MKKSYFVSVFLIAFGVYTKAQEIKGLGEFHLNTSTIRIIDTIAQKTNRSVISCDKLFGCKKGEKYIVELKVNHLDCHESAIGAPYDTNTHFFEIADYKILNKYTVKSIKLCFYKGILYEIVLSEPTYELENDFEIKYGQFKLTATDNETTCYVGNEKFELPEKTYLKSWTAGDVQATFVLSETRERENCERVIRHFGWVEYGPVSKLAADLNRKAEQECKQRLIEGKKKDLDSL